MMSVPKFTEDQLAAMLGLGSEPIDAETRRRVDLLAQQLLAGTVDWSQWE